MKTKHEKEQSGLFHAITDLLLNDDKFVDETLKSQGYDPNEVRKEGRDFLEKVLHQNELYPVEFNGESYNEKECSELFRSLYSHRGSLNEDGGIYMSDGMWVYPDGSFDEY